MSDDARRTATEMLEFVKRCYPDALIGLKLKDSQIVYRIYLYGMTSTVFAMDDLDQYVKMHLLNMLKNEIGMSADDLAAEILKYAAGEE